MTWTQAKVKAEVKAEVEAEVKSQETCRERAERAHFPKQQRLEINGSQRNLTVFLMERFQ